MPVPSIFNFTVHLALNTPSFLIQLFQPGCAPFYAKVQATRPLGQCESVVFQLPIKGQNSASFGPSAAFDQKHRLN
jgi:hypothetical protein